VPKKLTQEGFEIKGSKKYNNFYDYSLSLYVDAKTKLKIICPVHGMFEQTPNSHFSMGGCKKCGTSRTVNKLAGDTASFCKAAEDLNGVAYNYSDVVYERAMCKVRISCNTCQTTFNQTPNAHLGGAGCPCCAKTGYNSGKEGHLYVLASDSIVKVGITNRKPKDRAKSISKSSGEDFAVVADWLFYNGKEAHEIEQRVLRALRKTHVQPDAKFDGYSECFINVNLDDFKKFVHQEILRGYA